MNMDTFCIPVTLYIKVPILSLFLLFSQVDAVTGNLVESKQVAYSCE